jgi:hypothetical protein
MDEKLRAITVYIENSKDGGTGGFTIPLPTTKDALKPWLVAIGADEDDPGSIAIQGIGSRVDNLEHRLRICIAEGATLGELNYLAAKIGMLSDHQMDVFLAALDAGRHTGNVAELINLTENLDCFDIQPAFSEEQYAEFLIDQAKDDIADGFWTLMASGDPNLAKIEGYIEKLEEFVDKKAYGAWYAREENGVFTDTGYLTEVGKFREVYCSSADIPKEYRLFPEKPPLKRTTDVELPSFLLKLHALAGDYMGEAKHNIEMIAALRSSEYLLLLDGKSAYLTEAAHAYRRGTTAFDVWINASASPHTKAFAIHITDVHGRIAGDIMDIDVMDRQRDILNRNIPPTEIEATLKNGETVIYTPEKWNTLNLLEKDLVLEFKRKFSNIDYEKAHTHLKWLRAEHEDSCCIVREEDFLAGLNAGYMEQAENPSDGFLRVAQSAAQEALAMGDTAMYRLLPEGPQKLSQTDAVKTGLWYSAYREFAVKRDDLPNLDKWARRSAGIALARPAELIEQKKSHDPEL